MIQDPNRIYDGFDSVEGGVDGGRRPNVIGLNQVVSAENCVFRGGLPLSRPGVRFMSPNYKGDVYYGPSGDFVGPATFSDGVLELADPSKLDSATAVFTSNDVGSFIDGPDIPVGTIIQALNSPTQVTISPAAGGGGVGIVFTIHKRTNPLTFSGSYVGLNITSIEANFTQQDVGRVITGGGLPDNTVITAIQDPQNILYSAPPQIPSTQTFTIPDRFPNQGSEEAYTTGNFQSACYYAPKGANECIIALIGGRVFRFTPRDYSVDVEEIKLDQRNSRKIPIGYLKQADKWMIIQDGTSTPILMDNTTVRRAARTEVPVGDIMAYGMGRLVVCRNGEEVVFGDQWGSHAGTDPGDSVIQFTENATLNLGVPFNIPFAMGKITGAEFFPQLDTSTGIGQLLVFTSRGGASFDLSIPRDQWRTSQFQLLALVNTGVRGSRSIVAVNEDLWFRAPDGSRSFRQARSELTGWHHIPLSTNVRNYFDTDTPELLDWCSSIYFDNRMFTTTGPTWNHGRPFHTGIVLLDFDILSSFGTNSRPAWNGRWTKVPFTCLVTGIFNGRNRSFAFGLNEDGTNGLFELTKADRDDFDGPISSEIITRAFDFSRDKTSNPFSEKEIYAGDIWLSEVSDNNSFMDVQYRPDDFPEWIPWGERINVDAIGQYQAIDPNTGEPELREGFFPRAKVQKPDYNTDPTTKRSLRRGYNFQAKMNWTGYMALLRFRIQAQQLIENARAS